MKKLIYGGLFLALIVTSIISCESEDIATSNKKENRFVTDGKMLIFESVENYTNTVSDLTEEKKESLIKQVSEMKYKNYFSVPHPELKNENDPNKKMDTFLGKLLNEDGAIQIGDHIFKIDLNTEQVFVIPVDTKEANYNDLINGNINNKNVSVYSTNQDVLDILNNNGNSLEKACSGVGGGTYYCYPNHYDGQIVYTDSLSGVYRLNGYTRFIKAGIYFSLRSGYEVYYYSDINAKQGTLARLIDGSLFEIEVFRKYYWYKKKPCDSNSVVTGPNSQFYYSSPNAEYVKNLYSGIRNLNGYYFYIQVRAKYPDGTVTNASPYGGHNVNSPY